MSFAKRLLERLAGQRTAQTRWDERWSDPAFYGEYRLDELAHYSILAGYAKELKPGGSVLDVGCGDGILRTHLHAGSFSRYLGVDFPNAIERAQKRVDDRTSFAASDMREFTTAERFDVIVFNESLYYVEDPLGELRRYQAFMNGVGVFLISMHRKAKSEDIWRRLRTREIDHVILRNARGVEWIVGAFHPEASPDLVPGVNAG